MRQRSMRSQLLYALDRSTVVGQSRRADRERGKDTRETTYSRSRAETLRDRAKNFSSFMSDRFPEVRRARDITKDHILAYIEEHPQWSTATRREVISEMGVIERRVVGAYGSTQGWTEGIEIPKTHERIRDRAMDRGDAELLEKMLGDGRSRARDGFLAAEALGLRSCEVVGITGSDIDTKRWVAHLRGSYTKGGKDREVSIAPRDRERMRFLSDRYGDRRICPMQSESYNKALRRVMKRAGIDEKYSNTTEHAVRKLWARDRYVANGGILGRDPKRDPACMNAWLPVQKELGHGDRFRSELFETYIGGIDK